MILATTALENLSQDFFWFPALLKWFGELISNLSPIIGLVGAILLYYKKLDADRAENRREERRKVYADFISECGVLWDKISSGPSNGGISKQLSLMKRNIDELQLIAPSNIFQHATHVRRIYIEYGIYVIGLSKQDWVNKNADQSRTDRDFLSELVAAENALITAMRNDLGNNLAEFKGEIAKMGSSGSEIPSILAKGPSRHHGVD
ncbi:MAG: hypothetical protein V7666_08870 [Sulfitobacter sp.]|uniref:hypothetical protein n=1 Tax=Sulfitobacter sp. TaxID=1903071 RepID=UPI0030019B16